MLTNGGRKRCWFEYIFKLLWSSIFISDEFLNSFTLLKSTSVSKLISSRCSIKFQINSYSQWEYHFKWIYFLNFVPTIPVEGKEETEFASEKYYTSHRYVLCVSI